jgi:hypothetical protein
VRLFQTEFPPRCKINIKGADALSCTPLNKEQIHYDDFRENETHLVYRYGRLFSRILYKSDEECRK